MGCKIGRHVQTCSLFPQNHRAMKNSVQVPMMKRDTSMVDYFNDIFTYPTRFNSILQQEYQRQLTLIRNSSPHYEVAEDDNKIELYFELPGVNSNDIEIQLQHENGANDKKVLTIQGSRRHTQIGQEFVTSFEQSFAVDARLLDLTNISARLNDGILLVSTPKLQQRNIETKKEEQNIPIKLVDEKKNLEKHRIKLVDEKKNQLQHIVENKVSPKQQNAEDTSTEEGNLDQNASDLEISAEEDI